MHAIVLAQELKLIILIYTLNKTEKETQTGVNIKLQAVCSLMAALNVHEL
jgi:hypothetical protein